MILQVHGMLDKCLNVTTAHEYFEKQNIEIDFDKEEENEEYTCIQNILSLDVAIYITRRTSGCCGSIIDNLRYQYNLAITNYDEKFNKPYIDFNAGIDY